MRYQDIDWNEMWREARVRKSWQRKKREHWDQRAEGFAARNLDSPYVEQFLAHLRLEPEWSVLDMGCGPGTLALPLAEKVARVTAVDFSPAMLAELEKERSRRCLTNLAPLQAAWEDDWEAAGIAPHTVVIASRSLAVDDLAAALLRMDRWATKAVYLSDRVGAGPFDPDLFAALGRPFEPGPDYIITLNLLYSLGIHAHLDFITLAATRRYRSREEAIQSHVWMFDDLSAKEYDRLVHYVDERLVRAGDDWQLSRRTPPRWALIWWEK